MAKTRTIYGPMVEGAMDRLERRWPWCHIDSRWYLLWWHLIGRARYKRIHGHDWHKATRIYPWWERPFRKDARRG